jgi:hypothetical protein
MHHSPPKRRASVNVQFDRQTMPVRDLESPVHELVPVREIKKHFRELDKNIANLFCKFVSLS